jgi:hypothetical protein
MASARRACNWEQGERVPLRWDLVAAGQARSGNTRQTMHCHAASAAEIDDDAVARPDRIGGIHPF